MEGGKNCDNCGGDDYDDQVVISRVGEDTHMGEREMIDSRTEKRTHGRRERLIDDNERAGWRPEEEEEAQGSIHLL